MASLGYIERLSQNERIRRRKEGREGIREGGDFFKMRTEVNK